MKNDNLILWKLKYGKAFLGTYLSCADRVIERKKCRKGVSVNLFVRLGLLCEVPQSVYMSIKNAEIKLRFTDKGISIFDQLSKLINRGIILREKSGSLNWKGFQLA